MSSNNSNTHFSHPKMNHSRRELFLAIWCEDDVNDDDDDGDDVVDLTLDWIPFFLSPRSPTAHSQVQTNQFQ